MDSSRTAFLSASASGSQQNKFNGQTRLGKSLAAGTILLISGGLIGLTARSFNRGEEGHSAPMKVQDVAIPVADLAQAMMPEDWILYSFAPDTEGTQPTLVDPRQKIFGDIRFDKGPESGSLAKFSSSDSTTEANSKISSSMSVDAKYGAFAASASVSASLATKSKTRTLRTDCYVTAKKYKVINNEVGYNKLWDALRPDVKTLIATGKPSEIVKQIGVFFPTSLELGAVIRSTFIKKMKAGETANEFEATVKAQAGTAIAAASASATHSYTSGSKHSTDEIHMTIQTLGGDPQSWLTANADNFDKVKETWAATVNDTSLFPIKYDLDFIWNIIKAHDLEKGKAVETYTRRLWNASMLALGAADNADPYAEPILDVCYGSNGAWWKYDDSGTGAYTDLRVDQPQPVWCNGAWHYALGDIATTGSHDAVNYHDIPMLAGDVKHPVWQQKTWTDAGSGGTHDGAIWWLNAPHGYSCLASVMTNGANPSLNNYVCIPSKCVENEGGSVMWRDSGSGSNSDVTIYHSGINSYYIYAYGYWSSGANVVTIDPGCYT